MTFDQKIASDPEFSVWVAANAGTGKTKVLTDRVLRLLLEEVNPACILCITYTKAAAAEMEERISQQLGRWAISSDGDMVAVLEELTGKLPSKSKIRYARQLFVKIMESDQRPVIQTIHGFCQSLLMRFPLEAGVPPHFTLIDDQTARELLMQAKEEFFARNDEEVNSAIEEVASLSGEYGFNELVLNIIKDRSKFAPWFNHKDGREELLTKLYERNGVTPGSNLQDIFEQSFIYTPQSLNDLRRACAALADSTAKSDNRTFAALSNWLESYQQPGEAVLENYILALLTKENTPRDKLFTKKIETSLPDIAPILALEQQRIHNYVKQRTAFNNVKANQYIITIAHSLLGIYNRIKDYHCYLDYDDLILHAVGLLQKPAGSAWVLYKLDNRIDHILLDEAQDNSPAQWQIINALSEEFFAGAGAKEYKRTVFVVGDGKQSIFSFQGAKPDNFNSEQSRLRKRVQAAGQVFKNVRLNLSFRSTEPVLQAVDEVFATEAASNGLVFEESTIQHEAHRVQQAGRVEIWPLAEAQAKEELPPYYMPDSHHITERAELALARRIAGNIAQWLREKRMLPSQNRPVMPGDILILVQKRSGHFRHSMVRALGEQEIPFSGSDRITLNRHIAVQDLIALANFLLLPEDDLTLATVLKSPLVGLSEEDIFDLAFNRGAQSLWQRIHGKKDYEAACDYLGGLLARVDYMQPFELFAHILEGLNGRKQLIARLGKEITDPVNEFLGLAIEYGNLHTPSLQGFLHWLDSGEMEIKRDMEKGADEVRIMTVHGAKGLQAPIVFLPDTVSVPRAETGLLWSKDGLPLWSPASILESEYASQIRENRRREKEQEYRRLLYVAMTRAEDELYLCGWKNTAPFSEKSWYGLIRQAVTAKLGEGSGWEETEGCYTLHSPQIAEVAPKEILIAPVENPVIPAWVLHNAPLEPVPSRPLAPSHLEEEEEKPLQEINHLARLRGILVHRLLQYLPDIAPQRRQGAMESFIAGNQIQGLPDAAVENLKQQVNAILTHSEFAPFFSRNSVAEAPISGIVYTKEGKAVTIAGQIDRIAVQEDKVFIIDYKTGARPPGSADEVPTVYRRQMEAYRQLVQQIYPDKEIYCALLFTTVPKIVFI